MNIKDGVFPFTATMLARRKLAVSGVKSVLAYSCSQIRLRLTGETLNITGDELKIEEIGGGDVFVTGEIGGLQFEKKN